MSSQNFDVGILGGGLSGLTLALQLRQSSPDATIGIFERNTFPVPEACFKVGESSVEIGAYYFSKVVGQGSHIKKEQLPKFGLRYFFTNGDNTNISERLEVGGDSYFPTPSYQLDRGRFENHLAAEVRKSGCELFTDCKVKNVKLGSTSHAVEFGSNQKPIDCRWLVDCTGRAGLLKKVTDNRKPVDHNVNAVWFRIDCKLNIDEWNSSASWLKNHSGLHSRWFSTNHLMGHGYWVWIIPLSSGQTSVGIVADQDIHPLNSYNSLDKSITWLEEFEPQLATHVITNKNLVTDFLAVKHFSHSASEVFSKQNWCLSGEAGVFLDPFYSPGSDFIAISNTFITDLITRSLQGEDVRTRSSVFNQLYLSYFENTLPVYQGQYKMFGDSELMPVKVVWDYAIYWTQLAFIFMQGYLCDLTVFNRIRMNLSLIGEMNKDMQSMFQKHFRSKTPRKINEFIDITNIPYMVELNRTLQMQISAEEFPQAFASRTERLLELKNLITAHLQSDDSRENFFARMHKFPSSENMPLDQQIVANA